MFVSNYLQGGINDFLLSHTLGDLEDTTMRSPCLLENQTPVGRIARLRASVSLTDYLAKIKHSLGLQSVRFALP